MSPTSLSPAAGPVANGCWNNVNGVIKNHKVVKEVKKQYLKYVYEHDVISFNKAMAWELVCLSLHPDKQAFSNSFQPIVLSEFVRIWNFRKRYIATP